MLKKNVQANLSLVEKDQGGHNQGLSAIQGRQKDRARVLLYNKAVSAECGSADVGLYPHITGWNGLS